MAESKDPTAEQIYCGDMADDMEGSDLLALFVLDEIPNEEINALLHDNDWTLWLAGTYDTLPNYTPGHSPDGTIEPVDANWRSPFIGKTVPDAVNFIRNAPKPPKPLNTRFCAVVTKDSLRQKLVLICKSLDYKDDCERRLDEYDEDESEDDDEFTDDEAEDQDDDENKNDPGSPQPTWTMAQWERYVDAYPFPKGMGDPRRGTSNRRRLQELGNDYENVQVIPTPKNEVALFHAGFQRYKWKAAYRAWRDHGCLI